MPDSFVATEIAHCMTFVDILRWRALHQPDQRAYTFLADGEQEEEIYTYAQLDLRARSIAATLQGQVNIGDRALLLYPPGLDYIAAFIGCLYAGVIAVPAYPPSNDRSLGRIQAIVADAQAKAVLTIQQILSKIRPKAASADLDALQWITTDQIVDRHSDWQEPELRGDMLSFLQYTSGSTGTPKGVMVSHSNLMHNSEMIFRRRKHIAQSVSVSWLPMFHDMGLIAGVLQPLYAGFPAVLMAPAAFLQRPLRWLQAISKYRGTVSYAPNFAYELCIRRVTDEEKQHLDLRSWRIAVNASETVRAETTDRFVECFEPCGFRRPAVTPAYGLAEGTLIVSSSGPGIVPTVRHFNKTQIERGLLVERSEEMGITQPFVGCGLPIADQRIVIVHPEKFVECAQDEIGEIWVAGPSVAQGYWQRPEETQQTFHAYLADTGEGPFLRTGDLGFRYNGEIFVAGRLKDLIIIRGQNYYPQDIELAVERCHPSLRPGCGAAFSVGIGNEEKLVVIQEVMRHYEDPETIVGAIRQTIAEQYEIRVHTVALLRYGSILKTSSGKIQRRACREAWLARTLPVLFADPPEPPAHITEPQPISAPPAVVSQDVNKERSRATRTGAMQFSLLYFSSDAAEFTEDKYELLLEGARFADRHDFTAVWVPERHFHPFGGLYPNPSVLASALAMITQKIRLRAGSVVLPMHHPLRVAEEWSVVDNLSSGRVDIAFAMGWNPNDFALAPENYEDRKAKLFSNIEIVQKLWRGETVNWSNGLGKEIPLRVYPAPRQQQITPWITCSGSAERFVEAGSIGANVLTGLLFQSLEELGEKIALYRESLARHGYDPSRGHVTLMLHTFVGEDMEEVRQKVRQPFMKYLESSVDLWRHGSEKLDTLSPQEREQVLSYAFERYFQTHALFGTPQTCEKMVRRLWEIGVDEIAGLIDFGLDTDTVMSGLDWLNALRKRSQRDAPECKTSDEQTRVEQTRGAQIEAPLQKQLQHYLQQQIAQALERSGEEIAHVSNLLSLGLDSLMVASIVNNCQRDFQVVLDAGQFYRHTSLAGLAQYLAEEIHKARPGSMPVEERQPARRRQEKRDFFPLSFAQQRLWFLHQLQPTSASYSVPTAIQVTGNLDIRALEWSLEEIVRRHESLRTTFAVHVGEPVQIIGDIAKFPLPVVNLACFDAQERDMVIKRLAWQQAQLPFDLARGPLIRAMLLHLNPTEYVLLFTYHHIVADGWSRGVLMHELHVLYEAFVMGQPSPLAELPIQYADFAIWQRQWLQSQIGHQEGEEQRQTRLEQQLAYWRERLRGPLPVVTLPTHRPRPPVQTFQGAHQSIQLPAQLTEALKELSKREGVSLFMCLLAAFQVLLGRYTDLDDILVGTPIAGRNRAEIEPLIGFFVNTLVLRTDLSGDPSFRTVLQRIRDVCLEAYAHQEAPFEKVVEALQPTRDLSHHPFFQIMFALEDDAWRFETELTGVKLRQLTAESGLSPFDLTLSITSNGTGEVEYNTDLFEPATIARMTTHWQTLLQGVVADPTRRLSDLPLLDATERQSLLVDWNATHMTYPTEECIHRLFEAQVQRTPDRIAAVFEEEQLSYHKLNKQANRLAHYLQQQGVGPEVPVGLCLERSLDLVLAVLAVLKAGGAYVPLDPAYPLERLTYMMQEARLVVVLTQSHLLPRLPRHVIHTPLLALEQLELSRESEENMGSAVLLDNPVYIIYTSGSTGRPKGVVNTHRGLSNRLHWMQQSHTLVPADRVLQKTPYSFDISFWEVFWPLITGSHLVLARPEGHKDAAYLAALIAQQAITILHFVPAMLQLFLEEPAVKDCSGIRQVICSGEALPFDLQEHYFACLRAPLYNLYGPTEAAIEVTSWQCQPGERHGRVPIGKPVANTQIYLLDASLHPMPVGVPAELYIGGVQLARGYLYRPDLTAERFVPHPFSQEPGARLYRTGDLARYLPDGSIEYLGRLDHQVKLRGYRIELGEIEAALSQHPAIMESIVLVREYAHNDLRLIAYLTSKQTAAPTNDELRTFLQAKLPEYMLPSTFQILEAFPLTRSGKIDRQALLAQEIMQPRTTAAYVPPTSDVEHTVARVWQEYLQVEQVDIHTSFFELGGHSLLMAQVYEKLRTTFTQEITLTDLFKYPTIATLSRYISRLDVLASDKQQKIQEEELRSGKKRLSEQRLRRAKGLKG